MSKARVIYVEDSEGNQPALDTIFSIAQRASTGDDLYIRLIQLIRLGIRDIEKHGIIEWDQFKEYQFVTTGTRGFKVTLNLIKRLDYNKPLFEFRVNQRRFPTDRSEDGYAFRMVFFTYNEDNMQYILCTNALIKRSRTSSQFDQMVSEALHIYQDFVQDPSRYLKGG